MLDRVQQDRVFDRAATPSFRVFAARAAIGNSLSAWLDLNERNPCDAGSRLPEYFEPLGRKLVRQKRDASRIAAGLRQALRNAELNGISAHDVDDRDCLRCLRGVWRNIATEGKDHIGLALNQIGGEFGEPLRLTLGIPVFDIDVLAIDIAKLTKAFQKRLRVRIALRGAVDQDANARPARRRLLRMHP